MNENIFDKLDFGPFRSLLDDDDITDISYDNNGQIWIRSLTQGSMRVEIEGATPEFVEKLAFQCSNVMGTTFNNAKPFLDAESAELRMNFVHQSIATNGIALVIRKTPAKIRLDKDKLIKEDYFTEAIHDFLIKCVEGHCNIMVAGETGSGKTEFVKYLASHTVTNEKIITIEDTLELHLDKIYPQRDIVAMKTNNVASYSDVLVTCMRQNPKWILLSEVRSAEAVSAVRNSISSGHNILSTIHADKASAIPYRLYSLMETDLDVHQFLSTIYRYIQLGVHIKAFYSKEYGKFHRELDEVCEFYVDDNNEPKSRIIYQKQMGKMMMCKPSSHLVEYIENQNIHIQDIIRDLPDELPLQEIHEEMEFNDENVTVQEVKDSSSGEGIEEASPAPIITDPGTPVLVGTEDVAPANVPGAKPDVEAPVVQGAELGQAESNPVISDSGNVQLGNSVINNTPPVIPAADPNIIAANQAPAGPVLPPVTEAPTMPPVIQPTGAAPAQPVIPPTPQPAQPAQPAAVAPAAANPQPGPAAVSQPVIPVPGAQPAQPVMPAAQPQASPVIQPQPGQAVANPATPQQPVPVAA
ncbi:MAG: Flp pilus assembly complex ATPase component TadA [Bacilli bacterium]|nr:Flp pilus assembly complex ATPase component TadA [Bacilli bacterium]